MRIQLPHIPDDWDRVATMLLLFAIVAIMFAVSGCTTVTDYGMVTFADATNMTYSTAKGATFNSQGVNHSTMGNATLGGVRSVITGSVIKTGIGAVSDIVGDNIGSDLINK